ncbi:MAG: hypothetical protein Q8M65_03930 [Rhodoglobus sp.]|nr:hypothetical protein [Rhodoglobus sp.]
MLRDYGFELLNILERLREEDRPVASNITSFGPSISGAFRSLFAGGSTQRSQILYFPPGRFVLDRRSDLAEEVFTVPKGVELFFANDAILRIGPGVTLVIEGTIRAGQQQIFGFNRFELSNNNLRSGVAFPVPPGTITWPVGTVVEQPSGRAVPCGRVEIASDDVLLVRPEWWGARAWETSSEVQSATASPVGHDSWEAFQGAIDAACVGRAARRRAPIPIALGGLYQVVRTIEVRAPGALLPACLVWRGAVGVRGLVSVTRNPLRPATTPRTTPEVLLRLHPGVDFDLQNVSLSSGANVDGVIEVRCDATDPMGRRGFLRRVSLLGDGAEFLLHIIEEGSATIRRQFVLDGCVLVHVPNQPCRNNIRLDAGAGVMLRVSDTLMGAPTQPPANPVLTPHAIEHATCYLRGGSALLDSLLFHQALGPRPSRDPPLFDEPDGHDVFLGAPTAASGRSTTQLTMLQCESQGWWLLGRDSRVALAHQAVLLGVAHNPSVWQHNEIRRAAWAGNPTTPLPPPGDVPSVVWLGSVGQCVMIGSRLGYFMALTDPRAIENVGTVFANPDSGDSRRLYLLPDHVIRRDEAYTPYRDLATAPTLDNDIRHLVPILEDGVMIR